MIGKQPLRTHIRRWTRGEEQKGRGKRRDRWAPYHRNIIVYTSVINHNKHTANVEHRTANMNQQGTHIRLFTPGLQLHSSLISSSTCAVSLLCLICDPDLLSNPSIPPLLGGGSSPSMMVASSGLPFHFPLLGPNASQSSSSEPPCKARSRAFSPRFFSRSAMADCSESMYDSYLTISVRRY